MSNDNEFEGVNEDGSFQFSFDARNLKQAEETAEFVQAEIDNAVLVDGVPSVELDWAGDERYTPGDLATLPVLDKSVKDTGCLWQLVNPAGPGGGWPIIRVYGREPQLRAFLTSYHAGTAG